MTNHVCYFCPQLKVVTVQTKQCRTLAGSGQAGIRVGSDLGVVEFSEPGGLAVSPGGKVIYIADTNNHAIKTLDWETQEVKEVSGNLEFSSF